MSKLRRPLSDKVDVRVNADTSYQIKRIMDAVANEKGMEMMSRSGIKKNNRRRDENQALLREHATFKDLKFEKQDQRKKKNYNHNKNQNR